MATLETAKRLVVKIGSAILIDSKTGTLRRDWLSSLSQDISALKTNGKDVVIVSSGAIALGRARLSLLGRKLSLAEKQACAAAGQSLLTRAYEHALGEHKIVTAQALLTLNDTEDRRRWLNARSTLQTILTLGAVPIINENDTVATDEIRYGDNDRLAARTAQMLGADTLILLSDIDGLYTADPRTDKKAKHLSEITLLTDEIMAMGGGANSDAAMGSGGMATKLAAAKIAMQAGCRMCIMDGRDESPLRRLQEGERCSWFSAGSNPKKARQQWIGGALQPSGRLTVDAGAASALREGKSLLAAGVKTLSGNFNKGDAVAVCDEIGMEIARGLVSYDAADASKILGLNSRDISSILGYDNGAALIHRDNLVMM
ncbi:glutamate 5-kinase [Hellea balneolensis]|uniref:glutamate 5-kinase n=1 Tax=Hellea balneolensis TaxID=287478 RepID=UPI000425D4A4|nr:glutamate 5-kinase [Hellea balneolensis]